MKFNAKQNRDFWNDYVHKNKRYLFGAHTDKHIIKLENDFITSILKKKRKSTLLDIGCGNGQRTMIFSKYIKDKALGIDYSENMINEAKNFLNKQTIQTRKKISYEIQDIHSFNHDKKFDIIISCRSLINQPNTATQIKVFQKAHNLLKKGGSFIIAEESQEGISKLNNLRKKVGLKPISIRWHNLPLKEIQIFHKIKNQYKLEKLRRLGVYYFISRVIHPTLVYPKEPNPNAKINDIALKFEKIFGGKHNDELNDLEKFGVVFLAHFKKI